MKHDWLINIMHKVETAQRSEKGLCRLRTRMNGGAKMKRWMELEGRNDHYKTLPQPIRFFNFNHFLLGIINIIYFFFLNYTFGSFGHLYSWQQSSKNSHRRMQKLVGRVLFHLWWFLISAKRDLGFCALVRRACAFMLLQLVSGLFLLVRCYLGCFLPRLVFWLLCSYSLPRRSVSFSGVGRLG
jgi:hypothetical protein